MDRYSYDAHNANSVMLIELRELSMRKICGIRLHVIGRKANTLPPFRRPQIIVTHAILLALLMTLIH